MTAKEILLIKQFTEAVDALFDDNQWKHNIQEHFTKLEKLNKRAKKVLGTGIPDRVLAGKVEFGLMNRSFFAAYAARKISKTSPELKVIARQAREELGYSPGTNDVDICTFITRALQKAGKL